VEVEAEAEEREEHNMSATRDKSQRFAFLYSNLYQIYRKDKGTAESVPRESIIKPKPPSIQKVNSAPWLKPSPSTRVLKLGDLDQASQIALKLNSAAEPGTLVIPKGLKNIITPGLEIRQFRPPEFIGKRVNPPKVELQKVRPDSVIRPDSAVLSLKQNLDALNDLHSRLRFMLKELEDLVQE